jgi:hypothetical protein
MSMLGGSFADNLGAMWPSQIVASGNTIGATMGGLELAMNMVGESVLGSSRYYDLRDSSFTIALAASTAFSSGDAISLVFASQRTGFGLRVIITGGQLSFSRVEDVAEVSLGQVSYDPVAHKYLRVSNSAGITRFETSPNGTTYTTQAMAPNLDYVTYMAVSIDVTRSAASGPFSVDIGEINGNMAIGAACPIAALHDDFQATKLGEQWARSGAIEGTLTQHDGIAELRFNADDKPNLVNLGASTVYDLANGTFALELGTMLDQTSSSGQELAISARSSTSGLQVTLAQGKLQAAKLDPTTMMTTVIGTATYDQVAHRRLRFRVMTPNAYVETSPDGATWAVLGTTGGMGLDRVDLDITIVGATANAGSVTIDNVDL